MKAAPAGDELAFGRLVTEHEPILLAESAMGEDPYGYRREFIDLINKTIRITGGSATNDNGYPV